MPVRTPPYFKWRDGRPRWEPGPRLRQAGWKGRDLKSDNGDWLAFERAIAAANALNEEVAAWKASGARKGARRSPRHHKARSLTDLHARWTQSPGYADLAPKSRRDYDNKLRICLEAFGTEPVEAIQHHHLYGWWEEMHTARGHAMANSTIAVLRVLFSYARRIGWRQDNPAERLKLKSVPPRVVIWPPSIVARYVEIADETGHAALADAVVIALHTGQRAGDVLALEEPKIDGARALFQQSKRGARVAVPFTDPLARRIDSIRRRRRRLAGVVDLAIARRLVLRADGKPYTYDIMAKEFRLVRALTAAELPAASGLNFQDLRDTAITRLALAGCTVAEIRSITGHSLETVHQVLKHYLALDDRMAVAAIDKLQSWMDAEGIAI